MKFFVSTRSVFSYLFLLTVFVGLQACSGGGGGGSTPAPLTDQDASGIFTGNGTIDVTAGISDIKAIIYNNRFLIFSASQNVVYDGTISKITLKDMAATTDVYIDGVKAQSGVAVTGTVTTDSQIQTFTVSGTGKGSATIEFTYKSQYKSSVANDARIDARSPNQWKGNLYSSMVTQVVNNIAVFDTGQPDHEYDGNSAGVQCGYEGDFTRPATVNVYPTVMVRVTNADTACTVDTATSYSGLSTVVTVATTDDTLWYVLTNGTQSVFGVFTH